MSNKNYKKGRAKEYRIMDKLRKDFDIVARTAGSHSKVDIFLINKKKKEIIFIQSKPESMSDNKKKELEKELKWLNGKFKVSFKVV